MQHKKTFLIITLGVAVLAFFLTHVIWPDPAGAVGPSADLMPWFVLVNVFEALGFGAGIALLVTMWKHARKHPWALASITWLLVSWWPHDSLHRIGEERGFGYLLGLELGFHVTLIIAGFILAVYFMRMYHSAPKMSPDTNAV